MIHQRSNSDTDSRIELVYIQMTHTIQNPDPLTSERVGYSQFRIMQILEDYLDAAILQEGSPGDSTQADVNVPLSDRVKAIFPASIKFSQMNYDDLSEIQRNYILNNLGASLLFNLGLIPRMYQTQGQKLDTESLKDATFKSYLKTLKKYPDLWKLAIRNPMIKLDDKISPDKKKMFDAFNEEHVKANPKVFEFREREVLNFCLQAAKKSKKKTVVLLMGRGHRYGIKRLAEGEFRNRIKLVKVIDSTEGVSQYLQDKLNIRPQDYAIPSIDDQVEMAFNQLIGEGESEITNANPPSFWQGFVSALRYLYQKVASVFRWLGNKLGIYSRSDSAATIGVQGSTKLALEELPGEIIRPGNNSNSRTQVQPVTHITQGYNAVNENTMKEDEVEIAGALSRPSP